MIFIESLFLNGVRLELVERVRVDASRVQVEYTLAHMTDAACVRVGAAVLRDLRMLRELN